MRGEYQPGVMHPALQTLMRAECPACQGTKRPATSFCDRCLELLANHNGKLYARLRQSTGVMYDSAWLDARAEIFKARTRAGRIL